MSTPHAQVYFNRYNLFNTTPNPAPSGNTDWYTNQPIMQLSNPQLTQRVPSQTALLTNWSLPNANLLGLQDLNWAFCVYDLQQQLATSANADDLPNAPLAYAQVQATHTTTQSTPATKVCLFNVLVAIEWVPSANELNQLQWAFRRASDFLFDVSNGTMAFGQVVFGGVQHMRAADIQILASNRYHPRSWREGLYTDAKHMPIRLGRGMWERQGSFSIPWHEPEGYRVIVHEWMHYAIGLRDQYINSNNAEHPDLALPSFNPTAESIMAHLVGSSEVMRIEGGDDVWQPFRAQTGAGLPYSAMATAPFDQPRVGPERLPLPLPLFQHGFGSNPIAEVINLPIAETPLTGLKHGWVYVLRGSLNDPSTIIPQGSLDSRVNSQGFKLLGANSDDYVVVIGDQANGSTAVYVAQLEGNPPECNWLECTPSQFPLVAVMPYGSVTQGSYSVKVVTESGLTPTAMYVAAAGEQNAYAVDVNGVVSNLPSLDGTALLVFEGQTGIQLAVAAYSEGGNPPSHNPTAPIPLTAGSSEGNLMVFFNQAAESRASELNHLRVITTTMYGSCSNLPNATGGALSRGYIFALASNAALPSDVGASVPLKPTLVLNYDNAALLSLGTTAGIAGVLKVYSANGATPQAEASKHFVDRGYVALALNATSASGLFASNPTPEFFRLYGQQFTI